MGSSNTQLTSKVTSGSPYQLDKPQALKASTALLKHIKSTQQEQEKTATKKTLIGDNDSDDEDAATKNEAVWLVLTTKQHVVDKNRVKDIIADSTFPQDLSSRIEKVIGFSKLKARYQSFESRRQLFSEHDVFLADDRIAMRLVQTLGKIFYKSSKRPIPIRIAEIEKVDGKRVKKEKKRPNVPTDKDIKHASFASPLIVAKEIERTLNCASVQLAPSTTAAVRVGSSKFTPEQLSENVAAVVKGLTDKFVAKGWRNIKALHIKGANTMALPIWLADELWVEDANVLEAAPETDAANFPKKRKAVTDGKSVEEKKTKKTKSAEDEEEAASVAARKEKLQQLKAQALEDGETSKPEAPKAGGKKKRKSTS
ncbi:Ribosomal protein L1 [Penicillium brevicompactum]|uniref:Ribosomal protein L1 n=1 Tax=Penicillium brevicompactum TaxID=5074 RepID=UPI0025417DDE|nr:Ribosomal protein L1 [Penicillium brevicompactum]KAJ5318953.1 Ribosomal protein L1 [Penicillium brevicompactum]